VTIGPPNDVLEFLDRRLPLRRKILAGWEETLRALPAQPLHLASHLYRALGTLFEALVGLDLATTPPRTELLDFLEEVDRAALLSGLGYRHAATGSWHRAHPCGYPIDDQQQVALRILAGLDVAIEVDFSNPRMPSEQRRGLMAALTHYGFRRLTDDLLPGLLHLWDTHLRHVRHHLTGLGDLAAVAPVLAPGYGTADLVIGTTLVDVKVLTHPADELHACLDQLLFYLLLDRQDRYRITQLGVYLGWQGGLLSTRLDRIAGLSEPRHIADLRADSHREFADTIAVRRTWYEHRAGDFDITPHNASPP
jgi:hypothetical protein